MSTATIQGDQTMLRRLLLTAAALFLLTSCGEDTRIATIETQVKELQGKLATAQEEESNLRRKLEMIDLIRSTEEVAYLMPSAEGYSVLRTDVGQLTIALQNVQPYASGSRVTLRIGNLSAAHILGLKATLDWGSIDKKGSPNNQEAKSRDVSLGELLGSGSWTNIEVVLDGVPPNELGFVRVHDVTHRGIRLRS